MKQPFIFIDKPLPLSDGHLFTNCEGVRCQRGHCVGLQDVCNGVTNCEDSSDESKESCRKKHDVCTQNPFYRGCGKFLSFDHRKFISS